MQQELKKNQYLFFAVLVCTSIVLMWESSAQKWFIDVSIVKYLHRTGYFSSLATVYEPGKGVWHLVGWIGSLSMIIMMAYSVRKRMSLLQDYGKISTWLNVHIFLGLFGTILVTAHTTFTLGGIVSISFWAMIITAASGIVGRYIYIQIPRGMTGKELQIDEINGMLQDMNKTLKEFPEIRDLVNGISESQETKNYGMERKGVFVSAVTMMSKDMNNIELLKKIKKEIFSLEDLSKKEAESLLALCREKVHLNKRLNLLSVSHQLFHYWHLAHLPIAVVLFMVMFLHVAITIIFKVY